jgi:type II secretory pathway component PulM
MTPHLERLLQKCQRVLGDVIANGKNMLTRDYSMQDVRRLPQVLRAYWQQVFNSDADSKSSQEGVTAEHLQIQKSWNAKIVLQDTWQWALVQRKWILTTVLVMVAVIAFQLLINPYAQHLRQKLDLRPAQWAQLQQLVALGKVNGATGAGISASTSNGSSTVSLLDETEMQKIQLAFSSRGIKPGVLRMSADNPPNIELQVNEVMFSVLLDTLEDLRVNWHLYPSQMNVLAGSSAGMVSANGVLRQYSAQFGVTP